jgi:hypothetical protein
LAYFFEFDYADQREPARYAAAVAEEIARWPEWTDMGRPRLDLFQAGSMVLITDTRECAQKPSFVLTGVDAKIYLGCDMAQTPRSVARQLGDSITEDDIRPRLESFRDALLMVETDGHYLSLAVWRNRAARKLVASAHVKQIHPQSRSLLNVMRTRPPRSPVTCNPH